MAPGTSTRLTNQPPDAYCTITALARLEQYEEEFHGSVEREAIYRGIFIMY